MKIESLLSDRGAVLISTARQGQSAAGRERDRRRSVEGEPASPLLGRRRRSAGLSQFCGALSKARRTVRRTVRDVSLGTA